MAFTRARRRSRIKSFLKWTVFCLVILAMSLHVLVKLLLGPVYVETQVEQTLSEFWEGPVRTGEIKFGYDGVMQIRDVIFYDLSGTEVIKAESIRMVMGDWPSLDAPARRIEVEKVDVRVRLEGGKPAISLRLSQNPEITETGLEYMGVRQAAVSVENDGAEFVYDGLTAEVSKAWGGYELNIERAAAGDSNQLKVNGFFESESGRVEMELKFAQMADIEQTKVLLLSMGIPAGWGCLGEIDANLRVQGNIADSGSLWPEGTAEFTNWMVFDGEHIIGRDVNGVLVVGRKRLDLKRFSGILYNGSFNSSFYLDMRKPGPAEYGGDILATGIDMAKLTEDWEKTKQFTRGNGLFNLQFTGDTNGVADLRGYGSILIDDADLWRFPVIGELFENIGIWEYQVGGISDADVVFRLSGSEIIVERGRLSNKFSAIDAEPGGKIDLRSEQIDIYVVALPLKGLEKLINKVPVVNWFMEAKDKLIRLHLKGNWSQSAARLITKEPIKDVKEGTVAFFGAMIDTGGRLIEKVQSGFRIIFEPNKTIPKD